ASWAGFLFGKRPEDCGPLRHPLTMRHDLRHGLELDPVTLDPKAQREEIGVADRVLLAHHPRSPDHVALDQRKAGADVLRTLPCHVGERGFLARPAMAAQLVGVRDVDGGAEIAVEGLHPRKREGVERRELGMRVALRDESEYRRRLR